MIKFLVLFLTMGIFSCSTAVSPQEKQLQSEWEKLYSGMVQDCFKDVKKESPQKSDEEVMKFCECVCSNSIISFKKYIVDPYVLDAIHPNFFISIIQENVPKCLNK